MTDPGQVLVSLTLRVLIPKIFSPHSLVRPRDVAGKVSVTNPGT